MYVHNAVHVHMNIHLYRAPQCTGERIRKKVDTHVHTTIPFPTHNKQPQA